MIDDIKDSIKAKLYDFQYTPFMSSVLISWMVINHKYLLVFFADYDDLEKKLDLLKEWDFALHTPWFTIPYVMNVLLPILFGLFYVFVYPKINKKFYEYTLERNKELKKIKQDIEDETPITQEKARELKREHYKLADERDQALEKLKESQKEHAEALTNAMKPLHDEIQAHIAAHNVSNQLIEKLKAENQKIQSQLDQSNQFLMSKNDEYSELENKVVDLEKQLASVDVKNATVKVEGVQANTSVVTDNETDISFISVIKYLHDSYDTTYEANILEKMYKELAIPKAVTRNILNDLVQQNILSRTPSNQILITQDGGKKLVEIMQKSPPF